MPIYEYHCKSCSTDFEEFIRSSGDEDRLVCPDCKGSELDKLFSAFGTKSSGVFSSSSGSSCKGCSSTSNCSTCH